MFDDDRLQIIGFALLATMLVIPCIGIAERLRATLGLPRVLLFGIVLVCLGVAAEADFFLTMLNTEAAILTTWVAAIAGTIETMTVVRMPTFARTAGSRDTWAPFAVTFAAGMAYLALLCMLIPGSGSVLGNIERLGSLPNDNALPLTLAAHIAAHLPPKPFVGDWLSSDRPPLQAAFTLLFAGLTPFADGSEPRYQALSTLLQTSSFGLMYTLCRLMGARALRCCGVVGLAWFSGFFFFNSLFVWPKLIAAAYVAIAVAFFLAPGRRTRSRAILIGLASALGLMCHGAVVFAIPVLLAAWLFSSRRGFIVPFLWAALTSAIVLAPWSWYQNVYDPPGNRLLKWYLAGQIAPTTESLPALLHRAYLETPVETIVGYKVDNLIVPLGIRSTALDVSRRLDRESFFVRDALAALFVPFVAALAFARSRRRALRIAARFASISVGGIVVWALVFYLPATTIVHVGSYLTMCLMFVAGGIAATEWLPVFVPVACYQVIDFYTTWLSGFGLLPKLETLGGISALLIVAGLGWLCFGFVRREGAAEIRRWRRHVALAATRPGGRRRIYANRDWRGIAVLLATAIIVLPLEMFAQHIVLTVPAVSTGNIDEPLHTGRDEAEASTKRSFPQRTGSS